MRTRTTLSISEARKKLFYIAEDVQQPDTFYTLTEHGRPKVIIMSAEGFESWMETLEVVHEMPHLAKDIKEAHRDYERGYYTTLEELIKKEINEKISDSAFKKKSKKLRGVRSKK